MNAAQMKKVLLHGVIIVVQPISSKIVDYIINNLKLNNPYEIDKPLIQTSQDPRIQAEGKAGQSIDEGIIFVTESTLSQKLALNG